MAEHWQKQALARLEMELKDGKAVDRHSGEIGRALGRPSESILSWCKRTNRPAVTDRGRPKGEAST